MVRKIIKIQFELHNLIIQFLFRSQLDIKVNDILSVKGVWNSNQGCFIVSTEEGIVVTNPDNLVSGTSVVGSLFCKRKGILSERFRGLDSTNKIVSFCLIIK